MFACLGFQRGASEQSLAEAPGIRNRRHDMAHKKAMEAQLDVSCFGRSCMTRNAPEEWQMRGGQRNRQKQNRKAN